MQSSNPTEVKEKPESKATGPYPRQVNIPVTPPNASPIPLQTLRSKVSLQSMIPSVTKVRSAQETLQKEIPEKQRTFDELAAEIDASAKSGGRRMTLNSTIFKYLRDHQRLYYADITGSNCPTPKSTGSSRRFPASRSQVSLALATEPLPGNLGISESWPFGLTDRATEAHDNALFGLHNIFDKAPGNVLELLLATFTAYHYAKTFLEVQLPTESRTKVAAKTLPETDRSPTGAGSEGIPRKVRATLGMGLAMPESPGTNQPSPSEDGGTRLHEKTTRMMMVVETLSRLGKLVVAECLGVRPPVAEVIDAFADKVDAVVRSAEESK